jgi:hypothetical protein
MRIPAIRHVITAGALAVTMVGLYAGSVSAAPAPQQPKAAATTVAAPVTGSFTDALGGVGTATGTFSPSRFVAQGDQVLAQGVLNLTLVDSTGQQVGTAAPTVRLPLVPQQGGGVSVAATCQILDLVLGPLDLDLLGLRVHLDTVHLNITAESGPGNLVGNLLCAIAGLLDGTPPNLQALVILLNAILALLSL